VDETPQLLLMAETLAVTTPQGLTPTGWLLPTSLTASQWTNPENFGTGVPTCVG
jgi:hypothetical protein